MLLRSFFKFFIFLILLTFVMVSFYFCDIGSNCILRFLTVKNKHRNKILQLNSIREFQHVYQSIIKSHEEIFASLKIQYFYCEQSNLKGKLNLTEIISYSESLSGILELSLEKFSDKDLNKIILKKYKHIFNDLEKGGARSPNCFNTNNIGIIIPYRNRFQQLMTLVPHLHDFLQRQNIRYRIIVAEQHSSSNVAFNKGRIMDSAFLETSRQFPEITCFIFHDVDLLLEDDRNMYTCSQKSPKHLSEGVDKFDYYLPYHYLVGGVLAITKEQFILINGYTTKLWQWGGEDDDLYSRIYFSGLKVTRPNRAFSRYTMIKHKQQEVNKNRFKVLENTNKLFKKDGISNIKYRVKKAKMFKLFTYFLIDVGSSEM